MKSLFLAFSLLLAVGCSTTQAPYHAVMPKPLHAGLQIVFIKPPSNDTAVALRSIGAYQTVSPVVWALDSYDFHNAAQVDAVHLALAEGAHLSAKR